MSQVFSNYSSSHYESLKSTVYLEYEYIVNGSAWNDTKSKLYEIGYSAANHSGYSKIVFASVFSFAVIGASYGYNIDYSPVNSALVSGVSGLLTSTMGCVAHYHWGKIQSWSSSVWDAAKEHYIISSIMMGGVVGVSHSVGGGILVQAISGVVVGAIWGAAATTFAAGYAAYNNPRKYVESITDQVSSGAANIKYGLNWTWDTIVSSYEFVLNNPTASLVVIGGFMLGGGVGAAVASGIGVQIYETVTAVAGTISIKASSITGTIATGVSAVDTLVLGTAVTKIATEGSLVIQAITTGTLGYGLIGSAIGAAMGIGIITIYSYRELIEEMWIDSYKFVMEDHLVESMTGVAAVFGVTLAVTNHKAFIGLMALLNGWKAIYPILKSNEEIFKEWFINTNNEGECNIPDSIEEAETILIGDNSNGSEHSQGEDI
ncbi:MAG: hypothetical protein HRU36_00125 [Rickettsiales bacterium]|nr:hypothetical protein [Rickettsiales bacterium]